MTDDTETETESVEVIDLDTNDMIFTRKDWKDLQGFSIGGYLSYANEALQVICDISPLHIASYANGAIRKLGVVDGGMGMSKGVVEVLDSPTDAYLVQLGAVLSPTEELAHFIPSPLSLQGNELGDGHPDFRGNQLYLYTRDFCLRFDDVLELRVAGLAKSQDKSITVMLGATFIARGVTPQDHGVFYTLNNCESWFETVLLNKA